MVITVFPVPALSLTFNPLAVMVPVLGKPSVNTSPFSVTGAFVGSGDGVGVAVGAAAGLYRFVSENNMEQTVHNGKQMLLQASGLEDGCALTDMILQIYQMIVDGCSISQLCRYAEKQKAAQRSNVI